MSQANRGKALEQIVDIVNQQYYRQNLAVITKQHTKWLPIRGPDGKIVSAKVDEKASVDFRGSVKNKGAVAFDCKETHADRWYLSKLEPHQREFLEKCALMGDFSFILIAFWQSNQFFILPISEYNDLRQSGIKSVTPAMLAEYQINIQDYLGLKAKTRVR